MTLAKPSPDGSAPRALTEQGATSAAGPQIRAGEVLLEKYRVERELGRGGMGVVLAVRHIVLDELFALKILLPGETDQEMVDRFLQEARVLARLPSDHVAKVFDVGRLDANRPYMLMEYLRGTDLKELLDKHRPLVVEDAVGYVLQACEVLAEAHAHGVVHRDIKPSNLFLTQHRDGRPCVKVIDFGISKMLAPGGEDLTKSGVVLGTPMYMSPEQIMRAKRAGRQTDVWAIGVVLYELLTGRVPFGGETFMEVLARILRDTPVPPRQLRSDVPEWLDAIVMRCLQKAPEDRFQTMDQLALALRPRKDTSSAPILPAAVADTLPAEGGDTRLAFASDPESTKTKPVLEPSSSPGTADGLAADCLVVIYTGEPILLGMRFVLKDNPTRVGRGADNQIVLDGDSVSRRHAHFEQRPSAWMIVDDGSTNGTYCNDERLSSAVALKNGDRVKIGRTIFKFLSGTDIEAQYHEEIYRMTIIDGLTQTHNKRYLYEALDREIIRSRRHNRDLAILLFDIDNLKRINDMHGQLAGDFVLREIARIVQVRIRRDEVFARCGGEEFAILLPVTSLDGATELAERLRMALAEHLFVFRDDAMRATATFGVAVLGDDKSANHLMARAWEALHIGKREGGNRIVSESEKSASWSSYRRLLDGLAFLEKALTDLDRTVLVAFEVDDEIAIVEQLGREAFEAWFRELLRGVETSVNAEDIVGIWRDRYVLVALHDKAADAAQELSRRVRDTWTAKPRLRFAALTAAELSFYQDRALHVLIGRLSEDDLPFPFPALRAMVSTRRTALGRVKSLLDGIETALRFVVAMEVAAIREHADLSQQEAAAAIVAAAGRSPSGWESCAIDLAPLTPHAYDPISRIASAFSNTKVNVPLAATLGHIAQVRRAIARQAGLSEDAYGSEEDAIREVLDSVLLLLKPLSSTRLVSVAEIDRVEDGEPPEYALYLHRGSSEHFPIVRERLPFWLLKGWCYLLMEGKTREPLLLAPFVASRTCETCGRIEVAIVEDLVVGPPGTSIGARGVTSNHEARLEIPDHKRLQPFYQLVRERQ